MRLDHLTIIAPDLEAGAEHVRDMLGIDMPFGGRHPEMGTHNLLTRLGDDIFLEVIAVDPAAEAPERPRWFGLDDTAAVRRAWDAGHRLRGWVARTNDIDANLITNGDVLGQKVYVSRGGRSWFISVPSDGSLPAQGIAPSAIDWGVYGTPALAIANLGLTLVKFSIEHPAPAMVQTLYESLGIQGAPDIQNAEQFRYRAFIGTPFGVRELH